MSNHLDLVRILVIFSGMSVTVLWLALHLATATNFWPNRVQYCLLVATVGTIDQHLIHEQQVESPVVSTTVRRQR